MFEVIVEVIESWLLGFQKLACCPKSETTKLSQSSVTDLGIQMAKSPAFSEWTFFLLWALWVLMSIVYRGATGIFVGNVKFQARKWRFDVTKGCGYSLVICNASAKRVPHVRMHQLETRNLVIENFQIEAIQTCCL